jgi:predicted unusual protein kinase regulating ubiquinone biosynthesis (AarF/ABC1/UbiB family)
MFENIKRLYNQFQKLYTIKKQLELIHLKLPRIQSIDDLLPHFEKLKKIVFDCGSLYIKFLQWYFSKLKSNVINEYECKLELENTIKFINYFEDIFENCPFHSLEHTKEIFQNSMPGINLEDYIDITTLKEIASGSIGQVYYARRKNDNLEIAIKIKHPDIANDLENQLEFIKLIKFLQSFTYIRKRFNLIFNIDDFLNDIIQQCDFRVEAQNNIQFRKNFEDSQEFIIFPKILFQSEDVLVSEYIPGESIDNLSKTQQFYTTINFLCFFYQMFLVDNFIHGDLHCKNWKVHIVPNKKKIQLIVYDCGICFKNINVEVSNNFWFSLAKYDIQTLNNTMKQFITINNINFDDNDLSNEINNLFNNIIKNSFSTALLLKSIINFFTSRNIIVHKFLLNFTILICVIEEFLKKGDIINREKGDSNKVSMFDLMTDNQLDIITFCNVNKCYPKVAELFQKELDNKYLEYQNNITINNILENKENKITSTQQLQQPPQPHQPPQLFSSLSLTGLKFRPPE